MTTLVDAARRLQEFEGNSLTARLSGLERSFQDAEGKQCASLCASIGLDRGMLDSALAIKRVAGQINVVVHAVGILLSLPYVLQPDEVVSYLSLGAGNTGRDFDLETDRRIAEFKFAQWRGGADVLRQNQLFKDFFLLAEADTHKERYLCVLGLAPQLRFLEGRRALPSVLSRNAHIATEFHSKYPDRFSVVSEYYQYRRHRVNLVDLEAIVPFFKGLDLPSADV